MLIRDYFKFIPDDLKAQTVIAGSSAVDYIKATDVDLFVLRVTEEDRMVVVDKITKHLVLTLHQPFTMHVAVFTHGAHKNFLMATIQPLLTGINMRTAKPCQIILTTAPSARKVVDTFDLSVCMKAIKYDNLEVMSAKYTPPTEPIVICAWQTQTQARYEKLCARYGQAVNVEMLKGPIGDRDDWFSRFFDALDRAPRDVAQITGLEVPPRVARVPLTVNPGADAPPQRTVDLGDMLYAHSPEWQWQYTPRDVEATRRDDDDAAYYLARAGAVPGIHVRPNDPNNAADVATASAANQVIEQIVEDANRDDEREAHINRIVHEHPEYSEVVVRAIADAAMQEPLPPPNNFQTVAAEAPVDASFLYGTVFGDADRVRPGDFIEMRSPVTGRLTSTRPNLSYTELIREHRDRAQRYWLGTHADRNQNFALNYGMNTETIQSQLAVDAARTSLAEWRTRFLQEHPEYAPGGALTLGQEDPILFEYIQEHYGA